MPKRKYSAEDLAMAARAAAEARLSADEVPPWPDDYTEVVIRSRPNYFVGDHPGRLLSGFVKVRLPKSSFPERYPFFSGWLQDVNKPADVIKELHATAVYNPRINAEYWKLCIGRRSPLFH